MSWSRLGTGLLGLAGLLVAGLMGYAALFAGWRVGPGGARGGSAGHAGGVLPRVAVFLPDRRDWFDCRQAVAAGVAKGIARVVGDEPGALVVESVASGRRLRFEHHDVRGVVDTRAAVRELAASAWPPVAVVGSTTTVLTVALAEPLRLAGEAGPVLLIPWATAVNVDRPAAPGDGASRSSIPLMEVDAGRTFRFCPDNRALADSVVDCLISRDDGRAPARVFLVIDPFDPYSNDLAESFRRAIRGRKPDVEIIERADAVDFPSFARPHDPTPEPSSAEVALADSIVAGVEADPTRTTWAVLPLQDQPARRMIAALRRRASWRRGAGAGGGADPGAVRIVGGDAIERAALEELARRGGLSLWCASTTAAPGGGGAVGDDTQALAEIVSALVWALDDAPGPVPTAQQVRDALRRIDLRPDDPRAFGRRLAFDAGGERRGDPGRVVSIRPDTPHPVEFARTAPGRWEPVAPPPTPAEKR